MTNKPEVVFEVLGEGGGLRISRSIQNDKQIFLTKHQEHDFTDEGLGVDKEIEYSTFEAAFPYINKYPWHMLKLKKVHKDFRGFVVDKLIEKLNSEKITLRYLENHLSSQERILSIKIHRKQSGLWYYFDNSSNAATKWKKSNISFSNYQNYIKTKQSRFELSLIDLLYISNFKGGNSTINEYERMINEKLEAYSSKLIEIDREFDHKSLSELDSFQIKRLTELVLQACDLTKTSSTRIDGFSVSYLSGLLCAYFPHLIPIIDRRLLINLQIVTDQDKTKQGQIKKIQRFYPALIDKIASISKELGLSVREVDQKLFEIKIKKQG
jgi:hypothetical protein